MTKTAEELRKRLDTVFRFSLIVGIVAVVLALIGAFFSPRQFFESYIFGYHYWLAFSAGSLALVALNYFFNARWGKPIRRPLESAAKSLLVMAVLFLPIFMGMQFIFEWTVPEIVEQSHLIEKKLPYLNIPFFVGRSVFYFVVWMAIIWYLIQKRGHMAHGGNIDNEKTRKASVVAMILYFMTMTFASIDWAMSINAEWFSTGYSVMYIIGQCLTALSFIVAFVLMFAHYAPVQAGLSKQRLNDLGNLLLTLVMLWAYLEMMQLIIIWSGNLEVDNSWYYYRLVGEWRYLSAFILLFNFAFPFLVLLSRNAKRKAKMLCAVASALVLVRFIEMFWTILPSFYHEEFHIHWLNLVVPAAMGGIWLSAFIWDVRKRPIIAEEDFSSEEHEREDP